MRSFFVTAVSVLALAASTAVASRNLTMSVRWTYNSTFNDENDIFTSIMLSNVDKRVVFAFSGREAWRPMDSGYIVALSAVTGKPLWLSAKLPGPLTCLLFSETNVSVACLGQNTFAVVNRSTGHILASGYYGVNVTIFNSNMGGAIMRSIDERFVTFLLATNQSVVNATSSHYSVVVFDLANGHIQTISSTTVKRPLTALWFLDTHRMGASKFRISMLLWTGFEFTVVGQVCNQFGRYTAETGVANLTLDFLLPDDAVNVPGSSESYCRSPQVSANTVGGPTPHSLISINFYGSFDIRTFDTATGQLAAVTSIASSVPSSFNSVGSMWMFHADKQYFVNVIFEDVTPGLIFARMATANTTLWALNVPVIDGMITDDTNNTITMGGLMTSRVTKIAIDTGLVLFSTPLQDTSAISVWMDTAGPYLLDFRGSVLSVIDSVTGALSAQASLVSGPLTGETSSDNAIVKAVHDDDELVVLIGELNQVACLQFN